MLVRIQSGVLIFYTMSNLRKWLITISIVFNISVYAITFYNIKQNYVFKEEIKELKIQSDSLEAQCNELIRTIEEIDRQVHVSDSILSTNKIDTIKVIK